VALVLLLLLVLGADAYAIYRVYIERVGNALDYYPFWAGGRAVLVRQQNPYDPQITLENQEAIYGRPALPEENQHAYAYPAYAALIVWPFLLLPFPLSSSLWIAGQQALVVAAVALIARAIGWWPGRWHFLALCLAAMTFRYSMITFVLGQTSIWVLCCLALAVWAMRRGRATVAGIALAASVLKPQLAFLPALAMIVTATPRQRRPLILALAGSLACLLALSLLFSGFWIDDYWHQLQAYQQYSSTDFAIAAVARSVLPEGTAQILNAVGIALLLIWFALVLFRQRGGGQPVVAVAMALGITQLVVPQTGSYNMVLLLLPLLVILGYRSRYRARQDTLVLLARLLVWATLLFIPWGFWALSGGEGSWPPELLVIPALTVLCLAGLTPT
jgi:hypothetical protein